MVRLVVHASLVMIVSGGIAHATSRLRSQSDRAGFYRDVAERFVRLGSLGLLVGLAFELVTWAT